MRAAKRLAKKTTPRKAAGTPAKKTLARKTVSARKPAAKAAKKGGAKQTMDRTATPKPAEKGPPTYDVNKLPEALKMFMRIYSEL